MNNVKVVLKGVANGTDISVPAEELLKNAPRFLKNRTILVIGKVKNLPDVYEEGKDGSTITEDDINKYIQVRFDKSMEPERRGKSVTQSYDDPDDDYVDITKNPYKIAYITEEKLYEIFPALQAMRFIDVHNDVKAYLSPTQKIDAVKMNIPFEVLIEGKVVSRGIEGEYLCRDSKTGKLFAKNLNHDPFGYKEIPNKRLEKGGKWRQKDINPEPHTIEF